MPIRVGAAFYVLSSPLRIVAEGRDDKTVIVPADYDRVFIALVPLRFDYPPMRHVIQFNLGPCRSGAVIFERADKPQSTKRVSVSNYGFHLSTSECG